MVICLERGADLHMAQLMPLKLTVSCFRKIQIGFAFLALAHPGSPGQRAVKRVCVCVCVCDVAARLCAGDGPVAALVGGSSCSRPIGLLDNTVHLMTTKMISLYRLLTSNKKGKYDGAV